MNLRKEKADINQGNQEAQKHTERKQTKHRETQNYDTIMGPLDFVAPNRAKMPDFTLVC